MRTLPQRPTCQRLETISVVRRRIDCRSAGCHRSAAGCRPGRCRSGDPARGQGLRRPHDASAVTSVPDIPPRPSRSGAAVGRAHSDDGCDHLSYARARPHTIGFGWRRSSAMSASCWQAVGHRSAKSRRRSGPVRVSPGASRLAACSARWHASSDPATTTTWSVHGSPRSMASSPS